MNTTPGKFSNHKEDAHHIGTHLVTDMWHCQNLPDDVEKLKHTLINACHVAHATILDVSSYKFEPQGVTVLILLAESHISLHSWPEFNYVAIDVFTCGQRMQPQAAIDYLEDALKPRQMETNKVLRGENYAQR